MFNSGGYLWYSQWLPLNEKFGGSFHVADKLRETLRWKVSGQSRAYWAPDFRVFFRRALEYILSNLIM